MKMLFRSLAYLACLCATLLAGCMVGPDYVRPSVTTPAEFKEWKTAQPQDEAPRGPWWRVFGDPLLDELLAQLDSANQNIQLAEAQYRQARALVQATRAGLFPLLGTKASATRSDSGRSASSGTGNLSSGIVNSYSFALDASWEADLWGRVRRGVEGDSASAQASAGDLGAARLTAQAELISDYFQLRIADAQQKLLDDTVATYAQALKVTQNRYAQGVAARVDVAQAESQLKSTQAQALDNGITRAQLEHAIAILIGKAPADFSLGANPELPAMPGVPQALPSTLLERRPDIAAAERRVAAANAEIGVAQAAYFPTLTLSASGGYASNSFAHWFSLPNRIWSLGPALAATLFDAGLRSAQKEQAIAVYDQRVASYRQTVLGGFQEVEDNLVALRVLEQEAQVQDEAVRAAREALRLALNQYKAGTLGYLDVVVNQTNALTAQRNALTILSRRLVASTTLIKALGGDWQGAAKDG